MESINLKGIVGVFLALFTAFVYVFEMRLNKVYQGGLKRGMEISVLKIRMEDLEAKVSMPQGHKGDTTSSQTPSYNKQYHYNEQDGVNVFHEACRNGKLDVLEYLIKAHPDLVHSVDDDGWNAALHAARGGNIKILQLLVDNDINAKHKSNIGLTILNVACIHSNLDMSRYIIKTYPGLQYSVSNTGWNAALHAARGGNVKILQLLKGNKVDVKHKTKDGWNILHVACHHSNLDMSGYIIQTYPGLLHSVDSYGWNAALHAARGGNVNVLQLLKDNEIDVKHTSYIGWTILNVACIHSNLEMSRYIIKTYPELLYSVNNRGWNAALHAARGGNVKILKLLKDNKADVKHENNDGWNILHVACHHSNLEMSGYIIQTYPGLLHSVDDDGWNAALHAARGGNNEVLELLTDNKVDIKHKDNDGWNILHVACRYSNLEMSRYIIQTYPDLLHSVDDDGGDVASHAVRGGNPQILQLLADHGVKVITEK